MTLKGCEPCAFWTHCGCLKMRPGYPEVGDLCRHFEREPGADG